MRDGVEHIIMDFSECIDRYSLELSRTEQRASRRVRGRLANALYINPAHSLKVSVDVKHHVYLLTVHSRSELRSCVRWPPWAPRP